MRGARWWIVLVVVVALAAIQVLRPVPPVRLEVSLPKAFTAQGPALDVPWPSVGQSALAISGVGEVGAAGATSPQPIASVAKMMVAYLILKDHPLASGQTGPTVTVTPADVTLYQQDLAGGQSVVAVAAGETLTEEQLLQGLLLPSGNNLATMLAQWDAGTQAAFVTKMNAEAKALGMAGTTYADASGVSPATVSTAADQLILAQQVMAMPAFSAIVAMPQATLPVAGTVYNVNSFVGHSGIVGIKTGSTPQAGGCFIAAAYFTAGGHQVLAVAAALGQDGVQPLLDALTAGQNLVLAASGIVTPVQPVHSGQIAATLVAPWEAAVPVLVPSTPAMLGWNGLRGALAVRPSGALGHAVGSGARVATLTVTLGQQTATLPLRASAAVAPPSLLWRLTRH